MENDSAQIRALIERWAQAVHQGRIDMVVKDHAEDIVMFDVPPPYEGVRGADAYREVWPGFFEWQAQGAVFDVEELEVTAGQDVAFAHALVRCGTEEELAARPGFWLRLTLGLRKEADRWVVAHEHHSFPDLSVPDLQNQGDVGPRRARPLVRTHRGQGPGRADAAHSRQHRLLGARRPSCST